ncbi:hypothetical protein MtrunA17_Chr1g0213531 [Medicago truncatula]|uniref:Uncharacterized protein n=1 Tax=Medicago truncatula TaxID=3880 RepID=G7IAZ7_MEDTR|nr:uncharacterized protein LOC11440757 isoform X2 [Medicago truncatula]AES63083.1 hypothetical protein MTR_1g116540 [Medicago truncatula]RHN82788.1 hypothetical protein MtrunA17_Chr1g0213531 [Medicago truncatula]
MFSSSSFTLPFPPQPCLSRVVFASSFVRRSRSSRRSKRNNKLKLSDPTTTITTFSEPKLETVIDLSIFPSFHSNIRQFVSSGKEAYRDLQTLFTIDHNRRVIISCRPSTLHFVGTSAALTLIAFSVLRVFFELVSRFASWSSRNPSSYNKGIMVRRDRSLGGKEVVIGLSPIHSTTPALPIKRSLKNSNNNKVVSQRKLPKWWPPINNNNVNAFDMDLNEQDEYKRDAYRLVRSIIDSRMAAKDISKHDIIQLRQLCRNSGVQVSVEPTNIRESLYRASVNFVLDACSSAPTYSTSVHINGEDSQQFLAGFAENIGLENVRAATIVSAAVAARTRSCLLQAWALEMQGKHVDALGELSKICLLLRIFPPEESSPEMEMVSRGLEKHLKLEQRKHLMFLFGKVCSEDSHGIAREALGLTHSQNYCAGQLEDNIVP